MAYQALTPKMGKRLLAEFSGEDTQDVTDAMPDVEGLPEVISNEQAPAQVDPATTITPAPPGEDAPPFQPMMEQIPQTQQQSAQQQKTLEELLKKIPVNQQAQEQGIFDTQNEINNYLNKDRRVDLSPLMALSDAWFGGDLAKHYKGPGTPEEQGKDRIAIRKTLQDMRSKLSEDQAAQLKSILTGNAQQGRQEMAQKRFGLSATRLDDQNYRTVLNKLDNDKQLKDRLNQVQNLQGVFSILGDTQHLTLQTFNDAQQLLKKNLGIQGQNSLSERDKTQIENLGLNAENLSQIVFGKVGDIKKDNPFVQHLADLANVENQNAGDFFERRLKAVSSGFPDLFEKPIYRARLDEALKAHREQAAPLKSNPIKKVMAAGKAPKAAVAPTTQKAKSVIQNGHTYILNEATGKYE